MKHIAVILFVLLTTVVHAHGQKPCKDFVARDSKFVLCLPLNWTSKAGKDGAFDFGENVPKGAVGASFSTEEAPVPATGEEFAYEMIKQTLQPSAKMDMALLEIKDIETTSGLDGTKLLVSAKSKGDGVVTHLTYYIFDGPKNAKLTVIAVTRAGDKSFEPVIDGIVKSVRYR